MKVTEMSGNLTSLPGAQSVFCAPQIDRDLLLDFLMVFSRFEFALKRSGFVAGNERRASANWDQFGSTNHQQFGICEDPALREATDLLCREPPKKQVFKDNRLQWEEIAHDPQEPQFLYVLRSVRTIRNNLFHGGKFPDGPVADPARDRQLLQCALAVLRASVHFDSQVSSHFSGSMG